MEELIYLKREFLKNKSYNSFHGMGSEKNLESYIGVYICDVVNIK